MPRRLWRSTVVLIRGESPEFDSEDGVRIYQGLRSGIRCQTTGMRDGKGGGDSERVERVKYRYCTS